MCAGQAALFTSIRAISSMCRVWPLLPQHRAPSGSTLWDETFSLMQIFSKQNFTDSMIFSFFKINFPPLPTPTSDSTLWDETFSFGTNFFFKELLTLILSFLSFLFQISFLCVGPAPLWLNFMGWDFQPENNLFKELVSLILSFFISLNLFNLFLFLF